MLKEPVTGNDIYLTIDHKVQTLLEEVMNEVVEDYEPERISAIIMNAKTGEIIAMSNRPSYNQNQPKGVKNWYNYVLSTPYKPDSTIKIINFESPLYPCLY